MHELKRDFEAAKTYGVEKVPATIVRGERDHGIRFFGITAGYEFASLLEAILMVSTGESGLSPEVEAIVRRIDVLMHIAVMVTLTCPYCPRMVRLAHQFAFINDHLRADMIDAAEFPQLVQRYQVAGVPLTIINERRGFEGGLQPAAAAMEILKAVKPADYEQIEQMLREARGERRATRPRADHAYDVLVVGAGPAAMTAAIYAVRKGLDVALIGEHVGGQMTDTAVIENWPGMSEIAGQDLATLFEQHFDRNQAAEALHVRVTRVAKEAGLFVVESDGQGKYKAKTVIYCAGSQYRRLGVPGESRFLGRGIAFCATCDAPLFRDKEVAVVGGGNSAFTAVRDLLPFARNVHLIHHSDSFRADPDLIASVKADKRVTFHTLSEPKELLGADRLSGVRIHSRAANEVYDLPVDGVFLEIGLTPNS